MNTSNPDGAPAEGGEVEVDGKRRLLVIHGRDFKPESHVLQDLIRAALRAGIERDYPDCVARFDASQFGLAYYGDLTNKLLEAQGRHYDAATDLGDRGNALNNLRAIIPRKRFGIRQYDCLPGKSAVPEFLADVGSPLLGALGLTMPMLSRISFDFHAYLAGKEPYAQQVRERLRTALTDVLDSDTRLMLIAHGTGAVVAYDVLWQLSHDPRWADEFSGLKVDDFLTLGPPLGDSFIRKRLLASQDASQPDFPTNVISWHNVAAEDDYTCHDMTLADDFKKMMHNRHISAVHDYKIYNLAVRFGRSNPHSSVGYYIHPRVSKILVDWLQAEQIATPG